jgi:hypothetical protein
MEQVCGIQLHACSSALFAHLAFKNLFDAMELICMKLHQNPAIGRISY